MLLFFRPAGSVGFYSFLVGGQFGYLSYLVWFGFLTFFLVCCAIFSSSICAYLILYVSSLRYCRISCLLLLHTSASLGRRSKNGRYNVCLSSVLSSFVKDCVICIFCGFYCRPWDRQAAHVVLSGFAVSLILDFNFVSGRLSTPALPHSYIHVSS